MARGYYHVGDFTRSPEEILALHRKWFSDPPSIVACDIETISLKDKTLVGIGFASLEGYAFYYDVMEPELPWHLLWDESITNIWHNAPFDLARDALGSWGVKVTNIEDTIILCRWFPDLDNSLEGASRQLLPFHARNMGDVLKENNAKNVLELGKPDLAEKCCQDALVTAELWKLLRSQVPDSYYVPTREYLKKLLKMSRRGIKLDKEQVYRIDRELEAELAYYLGTCRAMGFNPLSPQQVIVSLNDMGIVLPSRWQGGRQKIDTSDEALKDISSGIAQLVRMSRKYNKLHGTYTHKWLDKERAFTTLTMEASTSRTTSRNDNLQNTPTGERKGDIVPKAGTVRSVFLPDDDWGTSFDLKQVELRVLAELSGDPELKAVLADRTRDIFTETQERFGVYSRVQTKNVVYGGCLYNGGPEEVARAAGIGMDVAAQCLYIWKQTYPVATAYQERMQEEALRSLQVQTINGQVLNIAATPKPLTEKHIRNCGANWPIQHGAAWYFMNLMLEAESLIPDEYWLLPIHDAMWLNGRWVLPKELESFMGFEVPIEQVMVKNFSEKP